MVNVKDPQKLKKKFEDIVDDLAKEYIELGLMNPSVRQTYGLSSDLFNYILWSYTQTNSIN